MTIRDNFPVSSPTILFDFKKCRKLDPRITFSRNDAAACATYFDASGVLRIAPPNFPRYDYDPLTLEFNGIAVEDPRTNSIRNNTMVGAVAGTPGTMPTNWSSFGSSTGITQQIVGTGVEDGISYIDVKFSGTASAFINGSTLVRFEDADQTPASVGQTWTGSVYAKLVAGSLSGVNLLLGIDELGAAPTYTYLQGVYPVANPNGNSLKSQRISVTRTTVNASIGAVQFRFAFTVNSGVQVGGSVNGFTLRIGMPQFELGSTVSSVIATSGSSRQRLADTISVDQLAPWYNPYEGTLYSEWKRGYTGNFINYASGAIITDDLTSSSSHIASGVLNGNSSQAIYAGMAVNGTSQLTYVAETAQVNNKTALAYATDNTQQFTNRVAETPDTSCVVPTGLIKLRMGTNANATTFLNGWMRRVVYYPNRLTQNNGIAITT